MHHPDTSHPCVWLLSMGGTIAGQAARATEQLAYQAGQLKADDLLASVPLPPDWAARGLRICSASLAQLDSKDMDRVAWATLVRALWPLLDDPTVKGVVITHGTDTLEETAFWLSQVLAPSKPVVLTCAMRPATGLSADGPQNLLDALTVAATEGLSGVMAVVAAQVWEGRWLQKVHPHRLHAFDGADHGPLGWVGGGRFHAMAHALPCAPVLSRLQLEAVLNAPSWPWVLNLTSHADADARALRACLASPDGPPAGVVVAGTGNGTVHQALEQGLREAQALGVTVWVSTRCAYGEVLPHGKPWTLTPWPPIKARLAMQLWLMQKGQH